MLPEGLGARIDLDAWRLPPVFRWLRRTGGLAEREMLKTFNCGIGMVVVCRAGPGRGAGAHCWRPGETVVPLGTVAEGQGVAYEGRLA